MRTLVTNELRVFLNKHLFIGAPWNGSYTNFLEIPKKMPHKEFELNQITGLFQNSYI